MAIRWYAACAALAAVAFLLLAADRAGLTPQPRRPASEAGLRTALLRTGWTIDLETGSQGTLQADMDWGLAARGQPYLGAVQRGAAPGSLIAETGALRWEDLDAAALAKLRYSSERYSAWGPDAPVRKGAVFAVRTLEGNFAKVRIGDIGKDRQLKLEWLVYPAPGTNAGPAAPQAAKQAAKALPAPGASLAWIALRDEALAAYREQRLQEALDTCGKAVAAAEPAGAAQHALALVTCGGLTDLQRRAAAQTEDWLKQGVSIAMKLDQAAVVAALGAQEGMLKERGLRALGVLHRDQNRPREAADNFALAVDTVRAMPPPETGDRRMALRADLYDLGLVLARMGLRGTARQVLGEAREYYLKTEPDHSTLKEIDTQLKRLEDPAPEPGR